MSKKTFSGGVHPRDEKHWTETKPIEDLPIPEKVIIPLQQHIGAPAEPIVNKGDFVKTGQILAETKKFVSVPVHATIAGNITSIQSLPHPLGTDLLSIVIEGNGHDEWIKVPQREDKFMDLSAEEMKKRIFEAAIVGMGGAAFPTHVKLAPPKEKPIDLVILNGVECEPFLTADHRLMLEKSNHILHGLRIIMKILDVKQAAVGIEKNKSDAIRLFKNKTSKNKKISVIPLSVKYPQGGEKQLIKAISGREVPSGGLPMDIGCLVHNVGTALAIYEAVSMKKPLIERIVTVTGPEIKTPKNLRVRIGTPFKNLIEFCGGYSTEPSKLVNGGPMMGIAQVTDDVPVIKGTSGILVLNEKMAKLKQELPCISCARCVDVCPMKLLPSLLAAFIEYKEEEKAIQIGLMDCIECGSCSYICPAKRNLIHYIRLGKALVNEKNEKTG